MKRQAQKPPYGFLDRCENGYIKGWAYDPGSPLARLAIELTIDGEVLAPAAADLPREDLEAAGLGDGRHAFEIAVPKRFHDARQHTVEGKISGVAGPLTNSPMLVALTKLPDAAAAPERVLGALSVVIVTQDRAASMEGHLRASLAMSGGMDMEFVAIDNGSTDETPRRLAALASEFPKLRWKSVGKSAEPAAVQAGVAMAAHELILLLGDNAQPTGEDLFRQHLNAHRMLTATGVAILGKIVWPNAPEERASFLMTHIQGAGQQQFGFYNLTAYTWVDWRFFNTSNFSFKKSAIAGWNAASGQALAYGVDRALAGGWRILYLPSAAVKRSESLTVRQFMDQRFEAGREARLFTRAHPEAAKILGTDRIDALLAAPARAGAGLLEDLIRMMEGAKSWAVVIESRYNLGSQNWHADLLSAVFEMSYLQGYVVSCEEATANYAAAYQYVLERFQEKMANAASFEVFGRFPSFPLT